MKRAEEKGDMHVSRLKPIALLGMLSICCLCWCGCSAGQAAEPGSRADLVAVLDMGPFGAADRAAVQFPHDLHTAAMEARNEDCTVCHPLREDGRLSPKYRRLADAGEDELLDLYHDTCIGCHRQRSEAGEVAGPIACGDCHRRQVPYVSSRRSFGLDRSLHYRHIKAAKGKCDDCHHVYDETEKALVYAEGKESSCRDCHKEQTEGNRVSFRVAAHAACIGCHRAPPAEFEKTDTPRPQSCAGCHDEEHQLAIEAIEEPPRLKRQQPDFKLLSASDADLTASQLRSVPFSHVGHERSTPGCRVCHHETLDRCSGCHTLSGGEESGGVPLYRAMHDSTAQASCVGCHALETAAAECAGCHAVMNQGQMLDDGCETCHAGPLPGKLASERAQYTSMDAFRPPPFEVDFSGDAMEVPEIVRIGVVSNEYEAAEMPHAKIANKLRGYIGESSMAVYFHGRDDVLCQGCHHQSPAGERPPLCQSCHAVESAGADVHKPGLRGAYHRQCLGCHERMGIQQPSDCVGCHARKLEAVPATSASAVR